MFMRKNLAEFVILAKWSGARNRLAPFVIEAYERIPSKAPVPY